MDAMNKARLAAYVREKMGDREVERVAYEAHISRASLNNLLNGKPPKAIRIYENIALGLGRGREEQREILKELLRLSGNLPLLTEEAIDDRLDARVLREIERRFPEVYQAALALVQAQERGALPIDKGMNQGETPPAK
jgi:hypothetical protein